MYVLVLLEAQAMALESSCKASKLLTLLSLSRELSLILRDLQPPNPHVQPLARILEVVAH